MYLVNNILTTYIAFSLQERFTSYLWILVQYLVVLVVTILISIKKKYLEIEDVQAISDWEQEQFAAGFTQVSEETEYSVEVRI